MATNDDPLAQMSGIKRIGALIALKNAGSITPEQAAQLDELLDDWMRAGFGRSMGELVETERCDR